MTRIISISSKQTNTQQIQTVTKLCILTRLFCEIKIEEKKEENRPITNNGLKNFTSVMTKIKSEE